MNKHFIVFSLLVLSFVGCGNNQNTIEFVNNSERVKARVNKENIITRFANGNPKRLEFNQSDEVKFQINLFNNGLKKSEGNLADNLKSGIWRYYYSNGTPKNHVTYKQGKINGRVFEVDSLGGVRFTGTQKMGELDGFATYFLEDGLISEMGHFKNGKQVGEWIRNE